MLLVSFLRAFLPIPSRGVHIFVGKLCIEFSVILVIYITSKYIYELLKDKFKK